MAGEFVVRQEVRRLIDHVLLDDRFGAPVLVNPARAAVNPLPRETTASYLIQKARKMIATRFRALTSFGHSTWTIWTTSFSFRKYVVNISWPSARICVSALPVMLLKMLQCGAAVSLRLSS